MFRPCFSLGGHVHCFTWTSFSGAFFSQFLAAWRWEATYILFYTVILQDLVKSSYLYSFCQQNLHNYDSFTDPLLHIPFLHSPYTTFLQVSCSLFLLHIQFSTDSSGSAEAARERHCGPADTGPAPRRSCAPGWERGLQKTSAPKTTNCWQLGAHF